MQFLKVHIVECCFRIEREEHCTVSRLFSRETGSNVGGDRRQSSACRVFLPKVMLSRLELDVCQYFEQLKLYRRFGRQYLPMLLSMQGIRIGMTFALCHCS